MKVVIKYAPLPITTIAYQIMVQVQYPSVETCPQIVTIQHGIQMMLSGSLEDVIDAECRKQFIDNNHLCDKDTKVSYVVCDLLVPKHQVVNKVGFFTKLWNNMKDMI